MGERNPNRPTHDMRGYRTAVRAAWNLMRLQYADGVRRFWVVPWPKLEDYETRQPRTREAI